MVCFGGKRILKQEDVFDWWNDRTEFMKTLPPIKDKKERIKLFQGEENE